MKALKKEGKKVARYLNYSGSVGSPPDYNYVLCIVPLVSEGTNSMVINTMTYFKDA